MQKARVHCGRRFLASLALGAASVVTTHASAADSRRELTLTLRYQLDSKLEACPSDIEFRRSIVEQLSYDPFRDDAPHRVVAELHQTDTGLSGRVIWSDAAGKQEGEREFASPSQDCAELARAISFSIAVQIQLLNGAGARPATAALAARPGRATTPSEPAPPPRVSPERSAGDRSLSLGLGPTIELGAAPSVAAGARFFGGMRSGALSLELGAFGTLPVRHAVADGSGFSTRLLGLALVPCAHHGSFALCASGRLSWLSARGFGVDEARSPATLTAQAGLRLGFQHFLSQRLLFGAHADGLGQLTPRTVYLNAVPVWSVPSWALSLGIDMAWIFP